MSVTRQLRVGDRVRFTKERIQQGFDKFPGKLNPNGEFKITNVEEKFVNISGTTFPSFGWYPSSFMLADPILFDIDSISQEI